MTSDCTETPYDIIVIGGGVSGLSALQKIQLKSESLKVAVLEANGLHFF